MPTDLLRPYGEPPKPQPVGGLYVYEDAAVGTERALNKLEAWRADPHDDPCGRAILWPFKIAWVGFVISSFGVALAVKTGWPFPALITGAGGLALLSYAAAVWSRSAPTTPEACIREFTHAINRGDLRRAYRLIAPADRDVWLRAAPTAEARALERVMVRSFINRREFSAYWMAARVPGLSTRIKLRPVAEPPVFHGDMCIVMVDVVLQRSMRLSGAAAPIRISKLLVRQGSEWRVFDGELIPPTERRLDWLPT